MVEHTRIKVNSTHVHDQMTHPALCFSSFIHETMKMKIEKNSLSALSTIMKIPLDHPPQRQPHPPLRRRRGRRQTDTRVPSRTTLRAAAGRAHRGARPTGVKASNRRPRQVGRRRRQRRQPSLRTMESGKLAHLIAVIVADRPCWCMYLGLGCTMHFDLLRVLK